MIVDLDRVILMDSSGVSFLVQVHGSCRQIGLDDVLLEVPERVAKALDVLGLTNVLPVRKSVALPST